ncbi:hypothetical protein [Clostridium neonatale]|uniref:hypothetical protein n=1 Tax=Clostridium neonatale TaxID=137838 RepID=UPI00291C1504|nr:hypothetical protein CNEO3_1460001 [Clostridium neonatale]
MKNCPKCFAEIFEHESTKYCVKCGNRVDINTCTDNSCIIAKDSINLPPYAKFCPVCKSATTHFANEPF